jgi:hypothetical protein
MNRLRLRHLLGNVTLALLLLLPLASLARMANGNNCRHPFILGNAIPPLAAIIQNAGGLPRVGGEMNSDTFVFSAFSDVQPVTTYSVVSVVASDGQPLHVRALDDDPNYGLMVDVDVTFADGTQRVMRWTTWRYGLVLCPFVIPYGDGPPWRIAPLNEA